MKPDDLTKTDPTATAPQATDDTSAGMSTAPAEPKVSETPPVQPMQDTPVAPSPASSMEEPKETVGGLADEPVSSPSQPLVEETPTPSVPEPSTAVETPTTTVDTSPTTPPAGVASEGEDASDDAGGTPGTGVGTV